MAHAETFGEVGVLVLISCLMSYNAGDVAEMHMEMGRHETGHMVFKSLVQLSLSYYIASQAS